MIMELVIDSRSQGALVQRARELWGFREVVWAFAERDTRLKYKQAALGVAWALIQPLSFMMIFVVVFGRVARVSGGGVPYAASALAGLVPWFFVQTGVSFGAQALLTDASLVRKVYFPREAPIAGAVLSAGLDFIIAFVLLLILEPLLGGHLTPTVMFVVPLWCILAVLASGVALILGALNVYYRDFRYALPLFLQLWLYASPVAYPLSAVPDKWRMAFGILNPLTGVLDGFHRALALGLWPDPWLTLNSAVGSCLLLLGGYWLFKRMEPGFAEAI